MAQLLALVVSDDEQFRKQAERLMRSCPVPIGVLDETTQRGAVSPDVVLVDIRHDATTGMAAIERVRGGFAGAAVFAIATATEPELILQAMRAGANEFFTWPPAQETFFSAIRRTASRRESAQGSRPTSSTLAFLGAKGGAGTTTMAVNCAVDLARLTKRATVIVDLKRGLGEVALFLGVRPRFTLLDAIDNLHRLDRAFLKELVTKHKSGVDLLAGSEQFDRPGAGDAGALEELLQVLTRHYEYVVVDAGSEINLCSEAGLYAADAMFLVANPDVACVRNAQRLIDRVRQLGACGERVRLLLNRAAEPFPIPPKQIETAVGHPIHHTFPSDYGTVSTALNSGVPLALSGDSDIAKQFDRFTRSIFEPSAAAPAPAAPPPAGRSLLGLGRIASFW
jgi:pilus assembly protein CpaE